MPGSVGSPTFSKFFTTFESSLMAVVIPRPILSSQHFLAHILLISFNPSGDEFFSHLLSHFAWQAPSSSVIFISFFCIFMAEIPSKT